MLVSDYQQPFKYASWEKSSTYRNVNENSIEQYCAVHIVHAPDSFTKVLFNVVDRYEQCGQHNIFNPVITYFI
jgi:hypothetical protein